MTATVYVAKRIAANVCWAVLGCLALYLGVDLVEVNGRTFAEILQVVPRALHDVAIGSGAIGGAVALSRLRRTGEWPAMRTLGIGSGTLIFAALPSVVGLVLIVATLSHVVLPRIVAQAEADMDVPGPREWAWAWEGGLLVANFDESVTSELDEVRIWFDVRPSAVDGSPVYAEAETLSPCQGQWCARDGWMARWSGGVITGAPFERFELPLLASEVGRAVRPASSLTTPELVRGHGYSHPAGRGKQVREVVLRFAYSLLCGLILLSAVVAGSMGNRRRGILGPVFTSLGLAAVTWLSVSWGIAAGW